MYEWVLYLDESGNTGTNMFDENQPFYVYAGWLIKNGDGNSIVKYIKESFKKVKAQELKSVKILNKYRPELYEFIQYAIYNGMYNMETYRTLGEITQGHGIGCWVIAKGGSINKTAVAASLITKNYSNLTNMNASDVKELELGQSKGLLRKWVSIETISVDEVKDVKKN